MDNSSPTACGPSIAICSPAADEALRKKDETIVTATPMTAEKSAVPVVNASCQHSPLAPMLNPKQAQSGANGERARCLIPTVSPLSALAGGPPAVEVVTVAPSPEIAALTWQTNFWHDGGDRCQISTSIVPPSSSLDSVPAAIEVLCGTVRGTFLTAKGRVLLQNAGLEQEVSATEMERLGGRGHTKKWRQSIRIVNLDGTVGRTIGEWLRDQGLDGRVTSSSSVSIKRPRTALHPVNFQDIEELEPVDPLVARKDMEAHLSKLHLGLRKGDPTVNNIPDVLPTLHFISEYGNFKMRTVDLDKTSYQQLLVLAKANGSSGGGVTATLLSNPPGVQLGREAFVSGQESPKRPIGSKKCAEGLALLGEYLSGTRAQPPWEALGFDKAPTVANQEVDLRQLYSIVKDAGGYEKVNGSRAWLMIAEGMGLDDDLSNGIGYAVRTLYQRFLLRFERQADAFNQFEHRSVQYRLDGDSFGDCVHTEEVENGKLQVGENHITGIMVVDGKPNGEITNIKKVPPQVQCT